MQRRSPSAPRPIVPVATETTSTVRTPAKEKGLINKLKQKTSHASAWLVVLVLTVSLNVTGCSESGPPRVPVSGRVTVDGEPLAWGAILFIPERGTAGPKAGVEVVNGEFSAERHDGPVVGKLRVQIRNDRDQETMKTTGDGTANSATENADSKPSIPSRYNRYSQLVIETSTTGENYFEFDLTTDSPETQ